MKRSGVLFLGGLLAASGAFAEWHSFGSNKGLGQEVSAAVVPNKDAGSGIAVDFQIPGFDFTAARYEGFEDLTLPGYGSTTEVGQPKLPVIRRLVEIPSETATLRVISKTEGSTTARSVGFLTEVAPVQAPVEKIAGALDTAPFARDAQTYLSNAFYPNFDARIVSVGSIRGRKVAMVEIAPLKYNPATQELRYFDSIRVEVIPGPTPKSVDPIVPSEEFDAVGEQTILNFSGSGGEKAYGYPAPRPGAPLRPRIGAQEKLLVVIGAGFENDPRLNALLQARAARFKVEILSVGRFRLQATADTIRNSIRQAYIQSASTNPLTYVLLVGDVETLPTYQSTRGHVTDNYYAAVDKADYASDITYPDLAVGRLAVKNSQELGVVVDKILGYERAALVDRLRPRPPRTPFAPQFADDWHKRIAFLATDDRYQVAEGTHNYVIDTYTGGLGYSGIFPQNPQQGGDKLYAITHHATTANVQASLDDGRIIVSYSGHGAQTYWAGPHVDASNVNAIRNREAKPYVMSHACVAGSFAMPSQDSFGEIWLKAPNGAMGWWGTTNSSYWDEDDILERVFFDGLFKNRVKSIGVANLFGLAGVRTHYSNAGNTAYYYEIYNLLGDPTVNLIGN